MAEQRRVRRKKVRMLDIARKSGVSIAAVSSVLRGSTNISVAGETRARILENITKLGYVYPNSGAKSRQNFSLLVISRYPFNNLMVTDILHGIERALVPLKGRMLLSMVEEAIPTLVSAGSSFFEGLAGVLFISRIHAECAQTLRSRGIPYAVVGSGGYYPETDMVYSNPLGYGLQGLEYLHSLGHERIGLIVGPLPHYSYQTLIMAFKNHMLEKFGRVDPHLIGIIDSENSGEDVLGKMLACAHRPTAIMGVNLNLYGVAGPLGLKIPKQLSFLTLDTPGTVSGISFIGADNANLGQEGVQAILRRHERPDAPIRHITLPVRIVENGSCRNISN